MCHCHSLTLPLLLILAILALCCTRQSLQPNAVFTKMVIIWYLISDHRKNMSEEPLRKVLAICTEIVRSPRRGTRKPLCCGFVACLVVTAMCSLLRNPGFRKVNFCDWIWMRMWGSVCVTALSRLYKGTHL